MITEKSTTVNGVKIAYTVTGDEKGKPIFFVHSLLSNSRDYDALGQALAQHGYKCIAIDLPGRGKSDWLGYKKLYKAKNYVPYCLAVIEKEIGKTPFDWFGTSLGGIIGMSLCKSLLGRNIRRLILVDVGAQIPYKALNKISLYAKQKTTFTSYEQALSFLKTRCAAWGIKQESTWEHLAQHNITHHHDAYHMHYDPQICEALPRWNFTVRLWFIWKKIKQPVILIRGKTSNLLPEKIATKMERKYTGESIKTITFKDCGHVPNMMEKSHIDEILKHF